VNLPNAITVGRIAITPLVAALPFVDSWGLRLLAFVLFIVAAVTDYWDGALARSRNMVTPLGQLLDPFADKFLLVGTLIPMFLLAGAGWSTWGTPALDAGPVVGPLDHPDGGTYFPFVTLVGRIGLPWWVLVVVLGRELFMTVFRQAAARRGVIIAAIGPAKWKTGFQSTWVGAAYFWFFAATLAADQGWTSTPWLAFAHFNGLVGAVTMFAAVALTLYSLWLYMRDYGWVVWGRGVGGRA
jgi:CDP-diacylglycerol--glycerol-3-phosphate 3-phosphatidyltransferase